MPDKVEKVNFGQIGPPPTLIPKLDESEMSIFRMLSTLEKVERKHIVLYKVPGWGQEFVPKLDEIESEKWNELIQDVDRARATCQLERKHIYMYICILLLDTQFIEIKNKLLLNVRMEFSLIRIPELLLNKQYYVEWQFGTHVTHVLFLERCVEEKKHNWNWR